MRFSNYKFYKLCEYIYIFQYKGPLAYDFNIFLNLNLNFLAINKRMKEGNQIKEIRLMWAIKSQSAGKQSIN